MTFPESVRYTPDHEWVQQLDDGSIRIGITHYAQDALGDVVFVELPQTGLDFQTGETLGEIESTKTVSDLFAPVAGTITEVNGQLDEAPELLNTDPYGEGWICAINPTDQSQLDDLLNAEAYKSLTGT